MTCSAWPSTSGAAKSFVCASIPLQAKQTSQTPLWALVWDNGAGRTPGMKPSWPDTKTRLPVFIACEYGPTAPGALSVLTTCRPAQQR